MLKTMTYGCLWNSEFGPASNVPVVVRYIQNQEAHHRKIGFDEEFLAPLKEHAV